VFNLTQLPPESEESPFTDPALEILKAMETTRLNIPRVKYTHVSYHSLWLRGGLTMELSSPCITL